MYMYFGFRTVGLEDPVKVYEHIEEEARKAMLKSGGSLSHHHGIGKLRKNLFSRLSGLLRNKGGIYWKKRKNI